VQRAWDHYCEGGVGPRSPWSLNFNSISWNTSEITARINGMTGGGCSDQTIPVVRLNIPAAASGVDFYLIGHHNVYVMGAIRVHCDCSFEFHGEFGSQQGWETYDFDGGGILNFIGRSRCPRIGAPFTVYLPGTTRLDFGGRISGQSMCRRRRLKPHFCRSCRDKQIRGIGLDAIEPGPTLECFGCACSGPGGSDLSPRSFSVFWHLC
jgi:hypothetical protein